jgi:hypothetical protein
MTTTQSETMKILRFTQARGFETIDLPFPWADDQDFHECIKAAGFGEQEESEGGCDGQIYCSAVLHYYNDESGHRMTMVDGPCRSEYVLTENSAEHLALRVALAPLAHVRMAEEVVRIRTKYGSLKAWRDSIEERRRDLREERRRQQAK